MNRCVINNTLNICRFNSKRENPNFIIKYIMSFLDFKFHCPLPKGTYKIKERDMISSTDDNIFIPNFLKGSKKQKISIFVSINMKISGKFIQLMYTKEIFDVKFEFWAKWIINYLLIVINILSDFRAVFCNFSLTNKILNKFALYENEFYCSG
jgi:hypothetical protein